MHIKSSSDISMAFVFNDIDTVYEGYYLYSYIWGGLIISNSGGAEYHVSTDLGCSDYIEEYRSYHIATTFQPPGLFCLINVKGS